jgi:hypothetical protein
VGKGKSPEGNLSLIFFLFSSVLKIGCPKRKKAKFLRNNSPPRRGAEGGVGPALG